MTAMRINTCCQTPYFIEPGMWPANSLDLNHVDYRICGTLMARCVNMNRMMFYDSIRLQRGFYYLLPSDTIGL